MKNPFSDSFSFDMHGLRAVLRAGAMLAGRGLEILLAMPWPQRLLACVFAAILLAALPMALVLFVLLMLIKLFVTAVILLPKPRLSKPSSLPRPSAESASQNGEQT